ncbi:MAG: hypothetical protein QOD10_1010 [Mycobacterium sp.]|jgi:hypothetical protein|nr:hypothetical protein [Mycobacterium sp.]
MAPGGAEVGPLGMPDGRVDEGAILPFGAPWEHPVTANKPIATMTAPHRGGRRPHQRTMSIYATLAAVTERFGFCGCCRP